MIAVGIGCRRGVSADQVGAAVQLALSQAQVSLDEVDVLAVAAFKTAESGVQDAAAALELPLAPVARKALEAVQPQCVTRSGKVQAAVGLESVAEAAAIAAAGDDAALILPRIAVDGVTCAVARGRAR